MPSALPADSASSDEERASGTNASSSQQNLVNNEERESASVVVNILPPLPADSPARQPTTLPSGPQTASVRPNSPQALGMVSRTNRNAFFIRHFSEVIVPSFATFDFQRCLGREFAVLGKTDRLLRYAICSLSARHLQYSNNSNLGQLASPGLQGIAQQLAQGDRDYAWYADKFHNKVQEALVLPANGRHTQTSQSSRDLLSAGSPPLGNVLAFAQGEDLVARLLTTCVCAEYENIIGSTEPRNQHLDEFVRLLTLLDNKGLFRSSPSSYQIFSADDQKAVQAIFWWWTISELEDSFTNYRKISIDMGNVSLWSFMGLHLEDNKDVPAVNTPSYLQGDSLSFALIRLACKVVNLVVESESPQRSLDNGSCIDVAEFQALRQDLARWKTRAHATFQPDHTVPDSDSVDDEDVFRYEAWYSQPSRAVAMLFYHMAQILLLIHQPPSILMNGSKSRASHSNLLLALRDIERHIRKHASRIVSITNGMNRCGAVRVRALQPLFVAGRTLTDNTDCRRLIEMIRSIEDDFAANCEYCVDNLISEWNISYDTLDLDPRPFHSQL